MLNHFARLIAVLVVLVTGAVAQKPAADLETLRAKVAEGDPYAAYELGDRLLRQFNEESLQEALEVLPLALKEFAKPGHVNERFAGIVHSRMGTAYAELTQYGKALEHFQLAETILSRFQVDDGFRWLRANNRLNHGSALTNLSRYEDSLSHFEAARDQLTQLGEAGQNLVGDTYLNEGISFEGLERFDKAIQSYMLAFNHYTDVFGPESVQTSAPVANIAWVFTRTKDYAQAEEWSLLALESFEKHQGRFSDSVSKVQINLGINALRQGRADDAIRWTMRAMPYMSANQSTTYDDQRWAFETLSMAMAEKGDTAKAITFGKLAVNAQQAIRNQNSGLAENETEELRNEWRRIYEHLADLLIAQGRLAEAQAVLNMEKEQEVFDFLRRDASANVSKTLAILSDSELSEQRRLDDLAAFPVASAQTLFHLTRKLENDTATEAEIEQIFVLQEALETSNAAFEAQVELFLASVEPTKTELRAETFKNIESYQALLAEKPRPTAMLQIAALENKVHLFLTLPETNLHFEQEIVRTELAQMVFDALQSIEQRGPNAQSHLQALHEILFAPVRAALEETGTEVVMLNLNGFLRYVPFAALHDGDDYLISRFAFSLYTATIPTQFEMAPRERSKTAGFGVTAAHPGFSPLPGVRRELETIFTGDDAQGVLAGPTALDEQFDEKRLRLALLKKPSILHIASHFNLLPGREDDSFLLLGDGTHLKLSEIRSRKALAFRGIDLVTLSACQTALGGGDGSEIEGFAAAAQQNGAGAVMASLWPVADDATPVLMRDFYRAMIDEGQTKAEALRLAQLAMLQKESTVLAAAQTQRAFENDESNSRGNEAPTDYAHPYYWSPFVLMGNWL